MAAQHSAGNSDKSGGEIKKGQRTDRLGVRQRQSTHLSYG